MRSVCTASGMSEYKLHVCPAGFAPAILRHSAAGLASFAGRYTNACTKLPQTDFFMKLETVAAEGAAVRQC